MKKNCNFICEYLDEAGECEAVQTECVGDMCECWKNCQSCTRSEDCENVMI